jgi:hypothetical protein
MRRAAVLLVLLACNASRVHGTEEDASDNVTVLDEDSVPSAVEPLDTDAATEELSRVGPVGGDHVYTPAWVIACTAVSSKGTAVARAAGLRRDFGRAGMLWIPDYATLSKRRLWLAYVGPFDYSDRKGVRDALTRVKRTIPGAYALKADHRGRHELFAP